MLARTLVAMIASLAIAVACTAAPPVAPAAPTDNPTDAPTDATPTASAALPTPAPATPSAPPATPSPTALSQDPDDFYGYDPPPATASPAAPGDSFVITLHGSGGAAYLLGPAERALYIFTNDSPGSSSCTGSCAATWPPLVIDATETAVGGDGVDGELATFERADGTLQVSYDGAPLYYYAPDGAPSDTRGDGLGGVWFLARP